MHDTNCSVHLFTSIADTMCLGGLQNACGLQESVRNMHNF